MALPRMRHAPSSRARWRNVRSDTWMPRLASRLTASAGDMALSSRVIDQESNLSGGGSFCSHLFNTSFIAVRDCERRVFPMY